MPSIAPLTPDQLAELYGAINEFVGTGDGTTKDFQLDFHPVVGDRLIQGEFVGVGDGVQTNYQLQYYPVTSGSPVLHKTSISGPVLVDVTHYTVVLATGAITLTPAGVAFLATEQLHAAYTTPSTLELHKTSISGPLLALGTDYTIVYYSGKITLTDAGVTLLGTDSLYAKYKTTLGLVNVLEESNASLRGTMAQNVILLENYKAKDADLRYVHESIEQKILDDPTTLPTPDLGIEMEKRYEFQPYAVLFTEATSYVQASEKVTDIGGPETKIVASVTDPFAITYPTSPLYPKPVNLGDAPGPTNPRWPDGGKPLYAWGLTGGTGTSLNANEQYWLGVEISRYPNLQAAGPDTLLGRLLRLAYFNANMLPHINNYLSVLGTYVIPSLSAFIANNPVPTEYVTAQDITDAQTALTNATNFANDTSAWLVLVNDPTNSGLMDTYINVPPPPPTGTRYQQALDRQAFLATRKTQVTSLLTTVYNARFFWITMRTSIGTGTLFNVINTQRGSTKAQTQISDNNDRIAEVMLIINAQ